MDAEAVLESILRGTLSSRRKSSHRTMRAVGRGMLANPQVLVTLAGLAWGAFETLKGDGQATPPPVPQRPPSAGADPGVARLVRLMVSAARADGALGPEERSRILEEARKAGVESLVEREIENPRPLAEILAGANDPKLKRDLYTLGYAIVRADEGVSGAEKIYLAQLAHALGLPAADVASIEASASASIDAAS